MQLLNNVNELVRVKLEAPDQPGEGVVEIYLT